MSIRSSGSLPDAMPWLFKADGDSDSTVSEDGSSLSDGVKVESAEDRDAKAVYFSDWVNTAMFAEDGGFRDELFWEPGTEEVVEQFSFDFAGIGEDAWDDDYWLGLPIISGTTGAAFCNSLVSYRNSDDECGDCKDWCRYWWGYVLERGWEYLLYDTTAR